MKLTNPTRSSQESTSPALKSLIGIAVLMVTSCLTVCAQKSDEVTPPKVEAKLIVGAASFAEPAIPHSIVGGAIRIYLTRRFSVEPEFLYMRHDRNDQDYFIQLNAAYDITDPTKKFVVYGIVGAGHLRNRSVYRGNDFVTGLPRDFDSSFETWTASIGGGVKIFLTKRLFVAPEVRVGREPDVRGTVSVGYVFAGRK